jgi:hypothetical protein
MNRSLLALSLSALLAACASAPTPAPKAPLPDNLKASDAEAAMGTLAARGVQIYECRAKKDNPNAAEWAFVAPEADLFDAAGRKVGTHYAGPHWESHDGSKIVGAVKSRADAPQSGAIPWLLLTTKSVGPAGSLAKVSAIQRINTTGGAAPADGCSMATLGKTARVGYTADYVLLATK